MTIAMALEMRTEVSREGVVVDVEDEEEERDQSRGLVVVVVEMGLGLLRLLDRFRGVRGRVL